MRELVRTLELHLARAQRELDDAIADNEYTMYMSAKGTIRGLKIALRAATNPKYKK